MTYAVTRKAHTQIAPPTVAVVYRYRYVANQGRTMIANAGDNGKMYPTCFDGGREKKKSRRQSELGNSAQAMSQSGLATRWHCRKFKPFRSWWKASLSSALPATRSCRHWRNALTPGLIQNSIQPAVTIAAVWASALRSRCAREANNPQQSWGFDRDRGTPHGA